MSVCVKIVIKIKIGKKNQEIVIGFFLSTSHSPIYKSLNGLGPKYIADMLTEYKPNRPLRSIGPRVHAKQGESTFSYYAARSWIQLPEEIRCAKTLATYKSRLKTHLFSCAFIEWALCYVRTDYTVFYI